MNIKKFFQAAFAISALFVGLSQSAHADIVTYTGDTTGGPTLDLTPFEFPGAAIPYRTLQFTVDTDGEYTFQATAAYDSVIILYENAFDPTDVTSNFLAGSDDNVSTTTSAFAAELVAGTTYIFVATGYDDPEYGFYSVTIGGPGLISVSAVPEPSTWLMLAFGLAAVTYAQRRKAQR